MLNYKLIDLSKIEDIETLKRYRRIFAGILKCWCFSSVAMASGCATGVMFGFSTVELIIILVFTVASLALCIPALFSYVLLDEVEEILRKRFHLTKKKGLDAIQVYAMKMLFWFILAVIGPGLIRIIVDFFRGL